MGTLTGLEEQALREMAAGTRMAITHPDVLKTTLKEVRESRDREERFERLIANGISTHTAVLLNAEWHCRKKHPFYPKNAIALPKRCGMTFRAPPPAFDEDGDVEDGE